MLGWWRRHGRDPEALSIVPQYEPPAGLTPGEIGMLVDNRADMRDVTATLVDLAVRGYIVIEEQEESALFGLMKSREYAFRLVRAEPATWTDLKPHEAALMRTMFDGGARTRVEIVTILMTPAFSARATMPSRSSAKSGTSRWQWLSTSMGYA